MKCAKALIDCLSDGYIVRFLPDLQHRKLTIQIQNTKCGTEMDVAASELHNHPDGRDGMLADAIAAMRIKLKECMDKPDKEG